MGQQRTRWMAAAVALTVASLAIGLPGGSPVGAESGGRVFLTGWMRTTDTRSSAPIAAATRVYAGVGVVTIWASGRDQDGVATISRCADASPVATIAFPAKGEASASFVLADNLCYSADVASDLIVDQLGGVSEVPGPGGSQYVPFASPQPALDLSGVQRDRSSVEPVPLTTTPGVGSGTTTGVVFLLEITEAAEPNAVVSASVGSCERGPAHTDLIFTGSSSTALALVPASASGYCAFVTGGGSDLTVTTLGLLSTEGPDPARLPPTLSTVIADVPPPGLRPLTPSRVLDTRPNGPGVGAGGQIVLQNLPITPMSTAVVLNVTVTEPKAAGFVTVWPCDVERPVVSNLNYEAGQTIANQVTVALGESGRVCMYSLAATHLLADISATYEFDGGAGIRSLTPERILDTRAGLGSPPAALTPGGTSTLLVAGRGGAPADGVEAVTLNVTATEGATPGFITVWPCDQPRPTASNLNFLAGQNVPNLVTSAVSPAGTVCLSSNTSVHLIADIAAVYTDDSDVGFVGVVPDRLLDTRTGIGAALALVQPAGTVTLHVAGRGGVPDDGAVAVTLNVTATETTGAGFVTVWPCDRPRPTVSNLNVVAGQTVPNAVSVRLAADGTVCLFTTTGLHLLADVAGFATAEPDLVLRTVLS